MSYRQLTESEKGINRNRTIQHFAWLTGTYHQFCHVSLHVKVNGKYRWQFPQEREQFISFIVPEVEKFCGKWYTEGTNPDAIPHPVRIAMEWHNGRTVRDVMLKHYPHLAGILPKVHARMEKLNIAANVPADEWDF